MARRRAIGLAVLLLTATAGGAWAADSAYYLYQYGYFGGQGDLDLETETAYGTRESRLLGEDTLEQSLRLRVSGTDWLAIEAWGGGAFQTKDQKEEDEAEEENRNFAVSGDLYARFLNQHDHYLNASLGAGYLYDYQGTSIPRVRLTVDRSWGGFDLTVSGLAEMPLNGEEEEEEAEEAEAEEGEAEEGIKYDEVDVLVSAAASYAVTDWARLGAETVLEDMEGFWEDEEAEGGAKLVAGPTARFAVTDQFSVRLNAAAVMPLTKNEPTRVADASQNQTGFLGRLALGYRF